MKRLNSTDGYLKSEKALQILRERLEEGRYPVGTLLPSERVLAVEFGISRATLRKAMNALLKEGRFAHFPGVGTRVQPADDSRQSRSSWRVLGLILPDVGNSFYLEVTEAIEYAALQRGYQLLLCNSRHQPELEEMHIRQLVERSVSGVILAHDPYREMSSSARLLGDSGIPLVCLYGDPAGHPCDWVAIDEVEGVQQVVRYLRSLNHSRIAFCRAVAGDRPHPRELAFRQMTQQCKLELPVNFVIPLEQIDSPGGGGILKELLSLEAPPTAIFAGNDRVAMIVLKHLASLDVSVPEQVSVIGFDNVRFTEHLPVPLTTVDQPKREMGRRAVDLLLERIELTGTSTSPRREVFHPHLIIRNSCQVASHSSIAPLHPA